MNISERHLEKDSRKPLEQNGTSNIEQVLYAIKNMPYLLMEHDHGFLLDFSSQDEDGQLVKVVREEYRIKSQWLEVYWLDRLELIFELKKTWKKHYEPFAEITNAFWELAQKVYIWRTAASGMQTLPTISQLPKPLTWTFLCERYLCEVKLKNSGYTGNSRPIGKGKLSELASHHYDKIGNVHNLNFGGPPETMAPIKALEQTAASIAQFDRDFREGSLFPYIATQRRCLRKIERSPLKTLYLREDGSLQIMGRGHDARKLQKPKKGFGVA